VLTTGFGFVQRYFFSYFALSLVINLFVIPLKLVTKNQFILWAGNPNAAISGKERWELVKLIGKYLVVCGLAGACQCALQVVQALV
jgi:hypothetical protein